MYGTIFMRLCFYLMHSFLRWLDEPNAAIHHSVFQFIRGTLLMMTFAVKLVCFWFASAWVCVCARVCARWYGDCVCLLCDWCSCHLLLLGSTMTHSFSFSLFLSLPSFFRSSVRLLLTLHWNWMFYIENYILDEFKRKKDDYKTCLATFWHHAH